MKTVELEDAKESLSKYARGARKETVLVTHMGKPVATVQAVGPHTDVENLAVTTDPRFVAMIERSRRLHPPGTGVSSDRVREELGIKPPKRKRKVR